MGSVSILSWSHPVRKYKNLINKTIINWVLSYKVHPVTMRKKFFQPVDSHQQTLACDTTDSRIRKVTHLFHTDKSPTEVWMTRTHRVTSTSNSSIHKSWHCQTWFLPQINDNELLFITSTFEMHGVLTISLESKQSAKPVKWNITSNKTHAGPLVNPLTDHEAWHTECSILSLLL
jgi:hypothetical protein